MRIAIFGSTGRVGSRLVEYALADGHSVRALARTPSGIAPRDRLEVVEGNILDEPVVLRVTDGADAVLSAVGGAGLTDPGVAQSQGMRNILAAMTRLGVRRVLGVAGSGILDSANGGLRHDQPYFVERFKAVSIRHMEAWHAMRDSDLDWTMVCAPDILPGERTGRYRTRDERLPEKSTWISVEDVADFLLREMTACAHPRRRVGLGY